MSNLQTRLRELRKKNNLTQSDMAKLLRDNYKLKTDRVMISKWETGFQTPEIYTIARIAELFNVSIDYLNGKGHYTEKNLIMSSNLTQGESIVLKKYRKLNDIGKNKAESYLDDLLANPSCTIYNTDDSSRIAAAHEGIPYRVEPEDDDDSTTL